MKPVDPGEKWGRFVEYAKDQPEYLPLPGRISPLAGTVLHTLWDLDFNERRAILDGARIHLAFVTFGNPLQPMFPWVEGTVREVDGLEEVTL